MTRMRTFLYSGILLLCCYSVIRLIGYSVRPTFAYNACPSYSPACYPNGQQPSGRDCIPRSSGCTPETDGNASWCCTVAPTTPPNPTATPAPQACPGSYPICFSDYQEAVASGDCLSFSNGCFDTAGHQASNGGFCCRPAQASPSPSSSSPTPSANVTSSPLVSPKPPQGGGATCLYNPNPDDVHPLRPNPGGLCTTTIPQKVRLSCGTDLVAVKKVNLSRGGPGCSPQSPAPGEEVHCTKDVTVNDIPISIGLSNLELPVAGVASNTAVSDTLSSQEKMSQYTSWYLQGGIEQSTLEPTPLLREDATGGQAPTGTVTTTTSGPLKIMPLGDSITAGYYPCKLPDNLPSNDTLVGSQDSTFCSGLKHEGHGGFTTQQVKDTIVASAVDAYQPDVVLIHLGTNDVGNGTDTNTIVGNLQDIVDTIHAHRASTTVFVAQIIPSKGTWLQGSNEKITELNQAISRITGATIVDQNSGFNPDTDLSDVVHPNEQGGAKIAAKFANAIQNPQSASGLTITSAQDENLFFSGPVKKLVDRSVLDQKREDLVRAAVGGTVYNQIIGYVKDNHVIGRLAAKSLFDQNSRRSDIQKIRLADMIDHLHPDYIAGNDEAIKWYVLWQQTPFAQTVDIPGEVFATLSQSDGAVKNARFTITSPLADFRVHFPHLVENDQLSQLLQGVFRAPGQQETSNFQETRDVNYSTANRQTPFNTDYCNPDVTAWNPGDSLEAKQTIHGNFSFTKTVEYSYHELTLLERQEYIRDGIPIPTTVEADVSAPLSIFARNPLEVDNIYDRLVNGPAGVYNAMYPVSEPIQDIPAAAALSLDCGAGCTVNPANQAGRKAELFFPHWGTILNTFHEKLQCMLDPTNRCYGGSGETVPGSPSGDCFAVAKPVAQICASGSPVPLASACHMDSQLRQVIEEAAGANGVPPAIIAGILSVETRNGVLSKDPSDIYLCQPNACGAMGAMQLLTGYGVQSSCQQAAGIDRWSQYACAATPGEIPNPGNVRDSINAGTRMIKYISGTGPTQTVWDQATVNQVAERYYGNCTSKFDLSVNIEYANSCLSNPPIPQAQMTYCDYLWSYYAPRR